jgi:hypothetical protein
MKLNTYASEAVPGCFVTIPSATAASTLSVVEGLGALQLNLFRLAYRLPAEPYDSPFTVSVLTQIVDKGYAVHGPDASCAPTPNRPRPRVGRRTLRDLPPAAPRGA